MKKILLSVALIAASFTMTAQVGVGTTTPKGALQVTSTTSGVIIPQFADLTAIQAIKKADGTTALDTEEQGMQVYNVAEKKNYMWDGTQWVAASGSASKFVDGTDPLDAIYTDGNVGIGLDNPSRKFHIKATGAGDNAPVLLESITTENYLIFKDANTSSTFNNRIGSEGDAMVFWSASSERLKLNADGKVSVNSPNETIKEFNVNGDVMIWNESADGELIIRGKTQGNHNAQIKLVHDEDADNSTANESVWTIVNGTDGTNDDLGILVKKPVTPWVRVLQINSDTGNVSIGTTTSEAKLDVNGAIKVSDSVATPVAGMIRYNTATDTFEGYTVGSGWVALH